MLNQFSRTQLLFGKEAMERLYNARVAVFGVGGVGCVAAMLACQPIMLLLNVFRYARKLG